MSALHPHLLTAQIPIPMRSTANRIRLFQKALVSLSFLSLTAQTFAQTGNGSAGISQATSLVAGYFDVATTLLYAIGAIVGLVGAVKVFNAWNAGEPNTNKMAAAWFGSCIFLVVVATVLKSFFGVS